VEYAKRYSSYPAKWRNIRNWVSHIIGVIGKCEKIKKTDKGMKIKNKIAVAIICLLVSIGLLVLIDILTGICYWNRLNLIFSSSIFNDLLSPITGVIAIVVYSYTLKVTIRQNRTINSFTIKDSLLKELTKLKQIYQNNLIDIDKSKFVTTIKFYDEIQFVFSELQNNKQYKEDIQHKDVKFQIEEIEKKSYFKSFNLIRLFTLKLSQRHFHQLQEYINEIIDSELVLEHKKQIIKEIEKEILYDYISFSQEVIFSKRFHNNESTYQILDDMYEGDTLTHLNLYSWKGLDQTSIIEFYIWYKNRLEKAKIK
jgi:hypothetical protein